MHGADFDGAWRVAASLLATRCCFVVGDALPLRRRSGFSRDAFSLRDEEHRA
jgi:hypothetical protein